MVDREQTRMTAAEFLELPETNTPMELIEGEVVVSPTPIPKHQKLTRRVDHLITPIVEKLGGEIYQAPLDVYLDDDNVVQPDVFWVAPDSRCKEGEKYMVGVPDLIVEVLSPGTARRDKITKFRLYERFGVPEYWILDGKEMLIEVYSLREGQLYLIGTFQTDEKFNSPILGNHEIDVNDLFGK